MKLFSQGLIVAGVCLSLAGFLSSAQALALGIGIALALGNPYLSTTQKLTSKCLAFAVVGLGAGMDLNVIGRVGLQGIGYTAAGISFALVCGTLLGRLLRVEKDTTLLIASGTAICGGSAIAAVSSAIKAKSEEVTVALGTIFILNATALVIFPYIGHHFELSQRQFGLWSALAIHDTSSVVGASLQYGPEALAIGTTVKLARALWIFPLALGVGLFRSTSGGSVKRPWFILGFFVAAALVTWVPGLQTAGSWVSFGAKRLLVVTLFLIGLALNKQTLKKVGVRPFIQGAMLWALVASVTLYAIVCGWIA